MNLEYMNVSSYQKMFYSVFNFFDAPAYINTHTIYINIFKHHTDRKGGEKNIYSPKKHTIKYKLLEKHQQVTY